MHDVETILSAFRGWFEDRHGYARAWKACTGGRVAALFCSYVPEEILAAAGVLPVRVYGGHAPQDVTERHLFGMFCPFCRDALSQGLLGHYDYAEGAVLAQSCLHLRQTYHVWKKELPVSFAHYIAMPNAVRSRAAPALIRAQYAEFREAVGRWTGRAISDDALGRAAEVAEAVRARLRELLELRRDDDPHLTGAEALAVSAACTVVDKAEALPLLDDLVRQLPRRNAPVRTADPVRLLFIGSESDDLALVETVEELGGIVVAEDHCAGSRWYGGPPLAGGEPLAALAARYLGRPPCPSKDFPERTRSDRAADLARRWRAQGALLVQQKFCDPHEADLPVLGRRLEAMGIPVLSLECDVTLPRGQIRTRVEAFLETLRSDDLFGGEEVVP